MNDTPAAPNRFLPAVLALWFALLLGLGSLLVPVASWEGVVAAGGIEAYLPQAAAPLGLTARLVIAAIAGLAGAIFGWLLGRWLRDRRRETDLALEDAGEPTFDAEDHQDDGSDDIVRIDPSGHGPDDDADRLVAGLPLPSREGLGESDVRTGTPEEEGNQGRYGGGPSLDAADDADAPVETRHDAADFGPAAVADEPFENDAPQMEPVPPDTATGQADLEHLSLGELTDRFERALTRATSGSPGGTVPFRDPPGSDPSGVVPFPARAPDEETRASLRDALRRLDETRSDN